jgi:hypothetical protein
MWYQETGLGMGQTLNVTNEKRGYTLADRGTYLSRKKDLKLDILKEGDPILLNVYHVICVNPAKFPKVNTDGAKAFSAFMVSAEAQGVIKTFGVEKFGGALFFPDAGKKEDEPGKSGEGWFFPRWRRRTVTEGSGIGRSGGGDRACPRRRLHHREAGVIFMDLIFEGIQKAFHLLITLDREVLGITLLSLQISGTATLMSLFIGITTGTVVALTRFPGRQFVVSLIQLGGWGARGRRGLFVTIFLGGNGTARFPRDPIPRRRYLGPGVIALRS